MWVCPDCKEEKVQRGGHSRKHDPNYVSPIKGKTKKDFPNLGRNNHKKGYNLGHQNYFTSGHTQETKKRISEITKQNWKDPEYREKVIRGSSKPHHFSDDSKRNLGKGLAEWRKNYPEAAKELLSNNGRAQKGKIKKITQEVLEGRKRQAVKMRKYRGPLASNWQGGISSEPYGIEWVSDLKKRIKERDRFMCRDCGIAQEELDRGFLNVHHINTNKKDNSDLNLITLCASCHSKRHSEIKSLKRGN